MFQWNTPKLFKKIQENIKNAVHSGEFQRTFPIGFYKENILANVQSRPANEHILYQYGGAGWAGPEFVNPRKQWTFVSYLFVLILLN